MLSMVFDGFVIIDLQIGWQHSQALLPPHLQSYVGFLHHTDWAAPKLKNLSCSEWASTEFCGWWRLMKWYMFHCHQVILLMRIAIYRGWTYLISCLLSNWVHCYYWQFECSRQIEQVGQWKGKHRQSYFLNLLHCRKSEQLVITQIQMMMIIKIISEHTTRSWTQHCMSMLGHIIVNMRSLTNCFIIHRGMCVSHVTK